PIIAEFSNLNSLKPKATDRGFGAVSPLTSRERRGGPAIDDSPGAPQLSHRERLLRGESSYTAASIDGRPNEHFIEDQPQGLPMGMPQLFLPRAQTTEERERLLRRLDMCAKAREESTKIMSIRFAQRDAVKADLKQGRHVLNEKIRASQRDRDQRWSRRMQRSPFAVDLVAENQRIDEENRVRKLVEQKRLKEAVTRSRDAHNNIFRRATAESDELDTLRTEKRLLLENERQLK
ncbi:unnamed protein product, partial [Polarella glacialis]